MPRHDEQIRGSDRYYSRITEDVLNIEFIYALNEIRKTFDLVHTEIAQRAEKRLRSLSEEINLSLDNEMTKMICRLSALIDILHKRNAISSDHRLLILNGRVTDARNPFSRTLKYHIRTLQKKGYSFTPEMFVAGLCFDFIAPIGDWLAHKYTSFDIESATEDKRQELMSQIQSDLQSPTMKNIAWEELRWLAPCVRYLDWQSRIIRFTNRVGVDFKTWRTRESKRLKQNHTYVDVTGMSFDELQWGWLFLTDEGGAIYRLRRGKEIGSPGARKEILKGMTWKEVREYIRNNQGELSRLENEYLKESLNKQGISMQNTDIETYRRRRKLAMHNFYKQVTVHSELSALKLGSRKRGRPRKVRGNM